MKNYSCTMIGALILTAVLFVFDMFFHGFLLKDTYISTQNLWRVQEDMGGFLLFNIFIYYISAVFIVLLYKRFILNISDEKQILRNSLEFGFLIGALMGIVLMGFYAYMPIPLLLAIAWFFGGVAHGALIFAVLYSLYKHKVDGK